MTAVACFAKKKEIKTFFTVGQQQGFEFSKISINMEHLDFTHHHVSDKQGRFYLSAQL